MKLIKLFVCHWMLLLVKGTTTRLKNPPIALPCTTNVDNEPSCNENEPEIDDFRELENNGTKNITVSEIGTFTEQLTAVSDDILGDTEPVDSETSKSKIANDTIHRKIQETSEADVQDDPFLLLDESVKDSTTNRSLHHEETADINLDSGLTINDEAPPGSSQNDHQGRGKPMDVDPQDDEHLEVDFVNDESSNSNETSPAAIQDGIHEINKELLDNAFDERNHQDKAFTEEKREEKVDESPDQASVVGEHMNNMTANVTHRDTESDKGNLYSNNVTSPSLNYNSNTSEATNFVTQSNEENSSIETVDNYFLDSNSSDENIAKSIDEGKSAENGFSNITVGESRSFDPNKPADMTLKGAENTKLDDKTASKDNFTLHAHDQPGIGENSNSQNSDDKNPEELQSSSDIPSNSTLVRKCCEESEFFSLETNHCEEAGGETGFKVFVQEILLPNSARNLELLTGRLQLCPGTNEPPLVSEPRFDTHSLEAFGHIRDDIYDVTYNHDHYCLELAAHKSENLLSATLVLAHCFPIKTPIRKCCEEQEFFSIVTQQCEPVGGDSGFLDTVRVKLIENSAAELEHITGLIQECPGSGEPPLIAEAFPGSHSLLPEGHLKDIYSAITYDHEHYCLELAAASPDKLDSAPLAIAYCSPNEQENTQLFPNETTVRKCCGSNEYYSTRTHDCEFIEGETNFEHHVREIHTGNSTINLKYIYGKVGWCENSGDLPWTTPVQPQSHVLLSVGHLKDLKSGINYDHDNYCLELAADSSKELSNAVLIAAYCPTFTPQISIRKCCNLNQYYNDSLNCSERLGNMSNYNSLVQEFLNAYPSATSESIIVGELKCNIGHPKRVTADETYLDRFGKLCEHTSGACHPTTSYCIEHFSTVDDTTLKASAVICPRNFFQKCCKSDEILFDSGCGKQGHDYLHSFPMTQLMKTRAVQYGFPTQGDAMCHTSKISSSTKNNFRFWTTNDGYLSLKSKLGTINIKQYCIEDYQNDENITDMIAVVCRKELESVLHVELLKEYSDSPSVGKCCPQGQLFENFTCVPDKWDLDLTEDPAFVAANVTDIAYTSLPFCSPGKGYHIYPFGQQKEEEDFAVFGKDKSMEIVSMDHGCFISKQKIRPNAFCVDYSVDEKEIQIMLMVCSDNVGLLLHQAKYSQLAVLLGISCTALTATAFSLISMRVRRGLVTVKKVNTLAGRILLSYVFSYLMAFLLLAIGMKTNTQAGNSCTVLAGFLMFFLLAAFQWNTSICLESLLLTLRVSASERRRYLCHSIWAWGVPGTITTIALTLDHHKDSLPCSVIIPRIGLYRCFFSDRNAQLLYLYLPMFISLCANMFLLSAARYVRSSKLKRLELGGRARATEMQDQSKNSDPNTSQTSQPTQQHSGLRTHQTRNLWTESMKLVVWSGATWLAEVVSFLLTRFVVLSEAWYNYLWYLPSSVNALRGVGIFIILVLTPENRVKIFKVFGNLGSWAGSGTLPRQSRSGDAHSSSGNQPSSILPQSRNNDSRQPGRRNMSIATTVTQLSSFRSGATNDSRSEAGLSKVHPRVAKSISQIDTRRNSTSSQYSEGEISDQEIELGAGGRRKSSLANFGLVSLPSVDEEDAFEAPTVGEQPTSFDTTVSTSDV